MTQPPSPKDNNSICQECKTYVPICEKHTYQDCRRKLSNDFRDGERSILSLITSRIKEVEEELNVKAFNPSSVKYFELTAVLSELKTLAGNQSHS